MSAVLKPAADHHVADLSLADWGRKEIRIAETEMPGLMAIREASSSIRSIKLPLSICWHAGQAPQGVAVIPISQFNDLARMRAIVVLPTPRVPVNK